MNHQLLTSAARDRLDKREQRVSTAFLPHSPVKTKQAKKKKQKKGGREGGRIKGPLPKVPKIR